jgi:hypothetical protein
MPMQTFPLQQGGITSKLSLKAYGALQRVMMLQRRTAA